MERSADTLHEAPVWSAWLRFTHWASALAVLVALATGWLMTLAPAISVREAHVSAGYGLALALAVRVYLLLFGRRAEHWRDLRPTSGHAVAATLRFYLTLGRAPLPGWYAHNPLWSPLYVLLWLLLAGALATGAARLYPALGAFLPGDWHAPLARAVAVWCGLHVVAVVLHDLRGATADISGMINGRRLFRLRPPPGGAEVPLRDLLGPRERR